MRMRYFYALFIDNLFFVAAQEFKIAQLVIQFVQQPAHLKFAAVAFYIQIEQILEFFLWIWPRLQLAQVQIIQRKFVQQMIQRARFMRYGQTQADFVGIGREARCFADTDKPGGIARYILNILLQDVHII